MKAASAPLIVLLATAKQFVMVDTYTFTLADGTVIVYVDGDTQNGYKVDPSEPQATLTG